MPMDEGMAERIRSLFAGRPTVEERRMFVVTSMQADFRQPARFNDQLIVTASLDGLTRVTFDIKQNIYRDNSERTLLLSGGVKAALLDADTHRPQRVPASLFEGNPQ